MADAAEALSLPPPAPDCGGESGRSSPSPAASPEFEFWMVGRNPSPALLTADELFSGGVVLPLHTLQAPPADGDGDAEGGETAATEPAPPVLLPGSGIAPTPDLPAVTFKWKDIFKAAGGEPAKDRKKMERRVSGNAELININIWPFSRSRSAGHAAAAAAAGSLSSRAKPSPTITSAAAAAAPAAPAPAAAAAAARKVSSAPCSRSNSRGESSGPGPGAIPAAAAVAGVPAPAGPLSSGTTSMLRRWVPGQGRSSSSAGAGAAGGIRVGRPSPVWQLRRNRLQQAAAEQKQAGAKKKAAAGGGDDKAAPPKVSSGAPAAAGCRNNVAGCSEGGEEGAHPPQGLFGLRTFFSKKVY